ncbi:MAG: helix-turn-helix domain-containing protein [Candidatus Melainabacteria bacterium]|nr:MAG: helix-turn-helix domain-containing protein [Candidatus Melainabacteria bacterium]
MNNRQMFSIKEAALEMGLDKKTLREKIKNGEIKVEKRIEGTKEKFFVTRKEVEKFLAENAGKLTTNQKLQTIFDNSESMYFGVDNLEPVKLQPQRKRHVAPKSRAEATPEAAKEIKIEAKKFDASELLDFEPPIAPSLVPDAPPAFIWDLGPDNIYDFEPTRTLDDAENDLFASRPYESPNGSISNFSRTQATQESTAEVESVLRTISQEYKRRLDEQREINQYLQLELAHAKSQLLLLPDLKKQADALYLKEFEIQALRKQVSYLKEAYAQAAQNISVQAEYTYVYEEVEEVQESIDVDEEKISLLDESVLPEMDRQIQKIKRVQEAEQSLVLDRLKLDATKRQDQNQNLTSMKSKIDELENMIVSMTEQVQVQVQEQSQKQSQATTQELELEKAPVKKPWWKVFLGL